MKNKVGFSLIELMIALCIGAMIISGLFSTLYQVGRAENSITMVTDLHQQAAIVFNHLERDIMGAFIPEQVDPLKIKKKENEKEEQKVKPIEKVFWGKSRDDKNLEQFTCISSNPLEVYLGAKNTKPKPRLVRIMYRLDPQKGFKDSFVLTRQEGVELSYDLYKKQSDKKKAPSIYQVIDNISSLSISYLTPDTKQEKTVGAGEHKKEYKKVSKWNSDRKPATDKGGLVSGKKNKGIQYVLPEFVEIKLELWDMAHEKKFNFSYTIPIMFKKGKPKRKQPQQPPQKKPMRVAQKTKKKSAPVFATAANGNKISITTDAQGKMILTEVPA